MSLVVSALLLHGAIGYRLMGLSSRAGRLSMAGLVDDGDLGAYYTSSMNLTETVQTLFSSNDFIWDSVQKDLKSGEGVETYLYDIETAMNSFLDEKKMWNREDVTEQLDKMRRVGKFVILTGGPSTGKSLLIRDFVKRLEDKGESAIVINGRAYKGPLEEALLEKLQDVKSSIDSRPNQSKSERRHQAYVQPVMDDPSNTKTLFGAVSSILEAGAPLKFIFLDEANAIFKEDEPASTMRALLALTKLTKEDKLVNVVMATSDYAFPFLLKKMGFNIAHIHKSIVLGELAPEEMSELLKEWKVRDNLSRALIASYGGHVLTAESAISELAVKQSLYVPGDAMVTGFDSNALKLVRLCEEDVKLKNRVLPFLKDLAEKGFVELDSEDPLFDLATECNVAGFVDAKTETPWIASRVGVREAGAIPALQSMRVEIALYLNKIGYI